MRGHYNGFEILSKGSGLKEWDPSIYVQGKATYEVHLNTANPAGTIQIIDAVLRNLDRKAEEEQREIKRNEKALEDFKTQLNRSFEHEEKLKDLIAKHERLNALLDHDKHEIQAVAEQDAEKRRGRENFAAKVLAESQAQELAPRLMVIVCFRPRLDALTILQTLLAAAISQKNYPHRFTRTSLLNTPRQRRVVKG